MSIHSSLYLSFSSPYDAVFAGPSEWSLNVSLLVVLAISTAVMVVATLIHRRGELGPLVARPTGRKFAANWKYHRTVALSTTVSTVLLFGVSTLLYRHLFHGQALSWGSLITDFVLILMVYDFGYYFMHRYLFHEWSVLKKVHTLHHTSRFPTAVDAMYMHPVESALGILLLFASTWLVGPVHPLTFAAVMLVYGPLNILIHSGLKSDAFPFAVLARMAQRHDGHHFHMKAGNYASVTPIPDLIFGTYE